jgi:calcineurin-like phosphoesterase family protein
VIDVGFIGDLHLGHTNEALRRGFSNVEEHDREVIKRWNSVVGAKTLMFLVGDATMENKSKLELLNELNGRKILISGNHETRQMFPELIKYFESICGALEYKGTIITHIPIHPLSVRRYLFNIHAHMHDNYIEEVSYEPLNVKANIKIDERYKNVSWSLVGGIPQTMAQLLNKK